MRSPILYRTPGENFRMKVKTPSIALALSLILSASVTAMAAEPEYREVIPPVYDEVYSYSEGIATARIGDKWGCIDKTGKEILPFIYDHSVFFSDGLAKIVYGSWLDDTVPIRSGFIDKSGGEVIPGSIWSAGDFTEGLAYVSKGPGTFGFIDKTGKEAISLKYDAGFSFSEGLAAVCIGQKWGFIDKTGKEIVPLKYIYVHSFSEGLAAVNRTTETEDEGGLFTDFGEDKWGFIDKTGEEVIPPKYLNTYSFSDGLALVYSADGLIGYIDKNGNEVIPPKFNEAGPFSGGLAAVKFGDKWGFIDKTGKQVIAPIYDDVCFYDSSFFLAGLEFLLNRDGPFSENLAGVKVGGKWGFIDNSGKEAAPPIYDKVGPFLEGMAAVCTGDKWGFIAAPGTSAPTPPVTPALVAKPTSSAILVNGKDVVFDAYNISGNNYFKLRDLAYTLSGTEKQFDVEWDGVKNAIVLTNGKAYTVVGGEMSGRGVGEKTPVLTSSMICIDGKEAQLTAYNIEGNNYFKLRDIGDALNFGVDWDGVNKTIVIDTSKGYSP